MKIFLFIIKNVSGIYIKNFDLFKEINTGFLEDLSNKRKAYAKSIFHHINQEEIKEIWKISV